MIKNILINNKKIYVNRILGKDKECIHKYGKYHILKENELSIKLFEEEKQKKTKNETFSDIFFRSLESLR